MRLGYNQRCPIHKTYSCECRPKERAHRKYDSFEPGVTRIPDSTVPRGYRERRSPAAMKRVLLQKIEKQNGFCYWCPKKFQSIDEAVPDHVEPRSMGGARRDDHDSNIVASCSDCNNDKGSKRNLTPYQH